MRRWLWGWMVVLAGCAGGGSGDGSRDGAVAGDGAVEAPDGAIGSDGAVGDGAIEAPDGAVERPDGATADAAPPVDPDAFVPPVERPSCAPCAAARAALTDGLQRVHFDLLMSRVEADRATYVPLVWGSPRATGGDVAGLAGTLPAPGWLGLVGAGRVVVWAGHEGAFGGGGDGRVDNDAFRQRLVTWLLGGGARLGFATGHGEWLRPDGFSPAVRRALEAAGVSVVSLDGPLDAAALAGVDALVLGNPWGEVGDAELAALDAWVRGGGGLLALGLGWSWRGSNADPDAARYPVQRLGARLGFDVRDGAISDPGAPAGTPAMPAYDIRPLDEWQPLDLVVLRAADTDVGRVKVLAGSGGRALYVIEGRHMGLSLPTDDWTLLDDPAGALEALDALYEAERALAGGHAPFGGAKVWIIGEDAPDAPWWMHSGNPIVYKVEAARAEIIARLNAEGHPGWGIAHEQGHNMHAAACGDLFVADGTGEVWPNVFGLFSYRQNGWDWAPQMGADLFAAGHAYHAQAAPDIGQLRRDPFILLGCLELIWSRYGWEGMERFMTRAAADRAMGRQAGDDATRIAYWVENLSRAYEVDFAPLIAHWGFPVSEATRAVTRAWPPSDIGW